ncbi:hypothetical protein [Phenylobacterium sp.]|uniref:hypothetical protein n=1 Tax=Phenylobacterium sp. TaxID=1871053 RepID=UPI0039191202
MRIPYPYRYFSEADAVSGEARALERETVAETEWLVRYLAGELDDEEEADGEDLGPWGPGYGEYLRLRDAATAVVEIAWDMRDPARQSPYAALGDIIIDGARDVLTAVRDYQPWAPLKESKA